MHFVVAIALPHETGSVSLHDLNKEMERVRQQYSCLVAVSSDGDAAMSDAANTEMENHAFPDDPMRLLPGDT